MSGGERKRGRAFKRKIERSSRRRGWVISSSGMMPKSAILRYIGIPTPTLYGNTLRATL